MTRRPARGALLACSMLLAACGLPFEEGTEQIANTCDSDADCSGGVCATVEGRALCVAREADLAGVIFQLEGTSADGTTVSHVFSQGVSIQGESADGAIKDPGLAVPAPFLLAGRILQPGGPVPGCTEADGSIPVKVEARPAKELAGLSQVFTGASKADKGSNTFLVEVPAGKYDVYVVPQPFTTAGCEAVPVMPPAIYRDIDVDPNVLLEPEAAAPQRVTGVVIPNAQSDLTNFVVDLLDAERGLPVSEAAPLGVPDGNGEIPIVGLGDDPENPQGIPYYTPVGGSGLVLRISDPDGALVVQWAFESLDLDGDGKVQCNLRDLISNPKDLEANIIDEQNRPIRGAAVTIKSLSLTGTASKNASFRVTTTSDLEGKIQVQLVPGDYQVLVTPSGEEGPAILDETWQVQPDALCCGKSFVLTSRSVITARVRVGSEVGEPAVGIPVLASPALPGTRPYFQNAIEALQFLPRQSTTTTDTSGSFVVPVDIGQYDVTVRTTATTGFPWLVLPSVVVAPIDQKPASTLDDVVVPYPALFVGAATADNGKDVAGATIRAYLPLAGNETNDTSPVRVVQIGETIVGANGRFVLPVPPTVARVLSGTSSSTSSSASSSAAGTFQP